MDPFKYPSQVIEHIKQIEYPYSKYSIVLHTMQKRMAEALAKNDKKALKKVKNQL